MPIDLSAPGITTQIAKQIKTDIDLYAQKTYDDGHRSHLGASLIGRECQRYLWYTFRWCFHYEFSGRMLRLFQRGHREEDRFVEYLKGIGCQVWTHDETQPLNSKGEYPQIRVSGVMGHFGGSLDGVCILPERYSYSKPLLLEFKTNATGGGFNQLVSSKMPVAKPDHWAQTCVYGEKKGFEHVLYLNVNKNDDDLHIEVTKLDHNHGRQMERKAELIITSQTPPARLSDDPRFAKCSSCNYVGICHKGDKIERNCRSCRFAKPVENAEWLCQHHNAIIPKDFIPQACGDYIGITDAIF